jgi:hypothetical protein
VPQHWNLSSVHMLSLHSLQCYISSDRNSMWMNLTTYERYKVAHETEKSGWKLCEIEWRKSNVPHWETFCNVNILLLYCLLNSVEEEIWFIGVQVASRDLLQSHLFYINHTSMRWIQKQEIPESRREPQIWISDSVNKRAERDSGERQ